jgi:hypothetical protein
MMAQLYQNSMLQCTRLPRHSAVVYLLLVRSMETKLPLTFVAIIFSTILLSLGCQKKTVATNSDSQSKTDLHESTKPLQAADIVGYVGTKLRKSVDHIIETNDQHEQEIQKMIEPEPEQ